MLGLTYRGHREYEMQDVDNEQHSDGMCNPSPLVRLRHVRCGTYTKYIVPERDSARYGVDSILEYVRRETYHHAR